MKTKAIAFLTLVLFIFSSCSKEDVESENTSPGTEQKNSAPIIELLSPSNDTVFPSDVTQVVLEWKGSDQENDPLRYDVYFTETEFSSTPTLENISETIYTVETQSGQNYQWKVVVKDNTHNHATQSEVQAFSVEEEPKTLGVYLEWQNVSASGYDLYFGTSEANEKILSNTTETSHVFSGLTEGEKYYYRIRAKGLSTNFFEEHSFYYYENRDIKIFDGNIELNTQEEVQSFGGQNFTEITGYLTIKQNFSRNINELGWLQHLEKVGDLELSYIDGLTSTYGLHNIYSTKSVSINNLPNLERIEMDKLISLSGLYIQNNARLQLISMNNLRNIFGTLNIGGSVSVFLETYGYFGLVTQRGNPILTNISFESLKRIIGSIYITANESLENVDFLDKIDGVGGNLIIWNNDALTDISGLSDITAIVENFALVDNDALISSEGLEKISIIAFETLIYSNDALENIQLNSLEKTSKMHIGFNKKLETLDGLESLREIPQGFSIYSNSNLEDFCGIYPFYYYGSVSGGTYIRENKYNPSTWAIGNGYCKP